MSRRNNKAKTAHLSSTQSSSDEVHSLPSDLADLGRLPQRWSNVTVRADGCCMFSFMAQRSMSSLSNWVVLDVNVLDDNLRTNVTLKIKTAYRVTSWTHLCTCNSYRCNLVGYLCVYVKVDRFSTAVVYRRVVYWSIFQTYQPRDPTHRKLKIFDPSLPN